MRGITVIMPGLRVDYEEATHAYLEGNTYIIADKDINAPPPCRVFALISAHANCIIQNNGAMPQREKRAAKPPRPIPNPSGKDERH
jgi:hypothetical protein